MTDNQAVDILLTLERDISGRIHSAITEILRKGYDVNGKEQLKSAIGSIRYRTGEIEFLIDKKG